MKHQQVIVDYWAMVKTSFTYLALVASFCILLRMTYAVFMLPRALKKSQEQLSANLKVFEAKIREKEAAEAAESKQVTEASSEDNRPSDAQPTPAITADGEEPKKEL